MLQQGRSAPQFSLCFMPKSPISLHFPPLFPLFVKKSAKNPSTTTKKKPTLSVPAKVFDHAVQMMMVTASLWAQSARVAMPAVLSCVRQAHAGIKKRFKVMVRPALSARFNNGPSVSPPGEREDQVQGAGDGPPHRCDFPIATPAWRSREAQVSSRGLGTTASATTFSSVATRSRSTTSSGSCGPDRRRHGVHPLECA